jgi:hypothetical protein
MLAKVASRTVVHAAAAQQQAGNASAKTSDRMQAQPGPSSDCVGGNTNANTKQHAHATQGKMRWAQRPIAIGIGSGSVLPEPGA